MQASVFFVAPKCREGVDFLLGTFCYMYVGRINYEILMKLRTMRALYAMIWPHYYFLACLWILYLLIKLSSWIIALETDMTLWMPITSLKHILEQFILSQLVYYWNDLVSVFDCHFTFEKVILHIYYDQSGHRLILGLLSMFRQFLGGTLLVHDLKILLGLDLSDLGRELLSLLLRPELFLLLVFFGGFCLF